MLALFTLLGMMVMIAASNFLTLYIGLELQALSLYAMVAMHRSSRRASEAAMKYFVLGALASGILLYGMSMIYGATGSLDLSIILSALHANNWNRKKAARALGISYRALLYKLKEVGVPQRRTTVPATRGEDGKIE